MFLYISKQIDGLYHILNASERTSICGRVIYDSDIYPVMTAVAEHKRLCKKCVELKEALPIASTASFPAKVVEFDVKEVKEEPGQPAKGVKV